MQSKPETFVREHSKRAAGVRAGPFGNHDQRAQPRGSRAECGANREPLLETTTQGQQGHMNGKSERIIIAMHSAATTATRMGQTGNIY